MWGQPPSAVRPSETRPVVATRNLLSLVLRLSHAIGNLFKDVPKQSRANSYEHHYNNRYGYSLQNGMLIHQYAILPTLTRFLDQYLRQNPHTFADTLQHAQRLL
jgi:hypothetical protein